VFLFIDIEGSTALAERLGEFAFHRLINRFVVDITQPIVAAYGEIHRYVGDELIASWKLEDGIADAHCVRACFEAFDRLAALSPVYVRDFGTPVRCRAGLHCGPVVTGEMGSVKKEIVFLDDTGIPPHASKNSAGKLVIAPLLQRHWQICLSCPLASPSARSATGTFAARKVMFCFM
jgi:Adenylate and Guanylate cyclase catalytic domain